MQDTSPHDRAAAVLSQHRGTGSIPPRGFSVKVDDDWDTSSKNGAGGEQHRRSFRAFDAVETKFGSSNSLLLVGRPWLAN